MQLEASVTSGPDRALVLIVEDEVFLLIDAAADFQRMVSM
jgi:hypothetical protein